MRCPIPISVEASTRIATRRIKLIKTNPRIAGPDLICYPGERRQIMDFLLDIRFACEKVKKMQT